LKHIKRKSGVTSLPMSNSKKMKFKSKSLNDLHRSRDEDRPKKRRNDQRDDNSHRKKSRPSLDERTENSESRLHPPSPGAALREDISRALSRSEKIADKLLRNSDIRKTLEDIKPSFSRLKRAEKTSYLMKSLREVGQFICDHSTKGTEEYRDMWFVFWRQYWTSQASPWTSLEAFYSKLPESTDS
jgi:hypothetical protein